MAIVIDMDACYGCRTCQLACGFHHTGEFDPDKSSIRVNRDYRTGVVTLAIDSTCDGCNGEETPLCEKYCIYRALSWTKDAKGAEVQDEKA